MGKTNNSFRKNRRIRLYKEQKGLCIICEEPMLDPETYEYGNGGKMHPDACTIEHLYDRYDPRRSVIRGNTLAAAHYKCNHERGSERHKALGHLYDYRGVHKPKKKRRKYHGLKSREGVDGKPYWYLLLYEWNSKPDR